MIGTLLFINFRRLIRESVRAFEAAHRLGYRVLVLGNALPAELAPYADESVACNAADLDSLSAALADLRARTAIGGIVCFTETAVEASAIAAETLGLPGLPRAAVASVRDKSVLRARTASIDGLPTQLLERDGDLDAFVARTGLPVLVKPVNASGSTGIFLIREAADLERFRANGGRVANPAYDPTMRRAALTFVAERYIEGQEVSVEGFVAGGEVTIVGITHKLTSDPYRLEVRHVFPAPLSAPTRALIDRKTGEYVRALGLDDTSFHLEGKYRQDAFELIEVAARPGGDYIASHLVPLATGYDFFENLARVALGEAPRPVPPAGRVAGIHYVLADREGELTGYRGLDAVLDHPWVEHVIVEMPLGTEIVLPPRDFRKQRLIAVVSTAADHARLTAHLDWVGATLVPLVTSR